MQITLDGFVAGPEGQLDWMAIDGSGAGFVIELADSCDTILMGRKMTPGFVGYWENVVDTLPDSPEQPIAQRMVNMRKIVFSRSQTSISGRNLEVENGDLATVVRRLKNEPGKDLLVYGGADFVSSLIEQDLIDEYYLFINPAAIGKGLSIFKEKKLLKLVDTVTFPNGIVVHSYLPA